DVGLRPSASETSRPEPVNFPLGEDQESSAIEFVLILCMVRLGCSNRFVALTTRSSLIRFTTRATTKYFDSPRSSCHPATMTKDNHRRHSGRLRCALMLL